MGLGKKYCGCSNTPSCQCSSCRKSCKKSVPDCGCDESSGVFSGSSCCQESVQTPPAPCCESHKTVVKPGVCFRPTCSVVASADPFDIQFKNNCDFDLPINVEEVFFYHDGAGKLNLHSQDGSTYRVSVVDPNRAGTVIEKDDCVLIYVDVNEGELSANARCLIGNFIAPALNSDQTIYLYNGAGVTIGSILTFTWGGEQGSYRVKEFLSASGHIYAYTVTNTGEGFLTGTIIDGGAEGACEIPVEILTNIDLCDTEETEILDTISGCLNGVPRALVPAGPGFVPAGNEAGDGWDQKKITDFDCCVFTDTVLKFSGNVCTGSQDTTVLKDVGLECFDEAIARAAFGNTHVVMDIAGTKFRVVDYDDSTRELVLQPTSPFYLPEGESFLEYPANTQICLGECCDQCTNGPQITNHNTTGDGDATRASNFLFEVNIARPTVSGTVRHYLIGYNTSGSVVATEITNTYNDAPLQPGIGKPTHSDPLIFRQKICGSSRHGCPQTLEIEYNYELAMSGLVANTRAHWEISNYIQPSATLADDATPNPYSYISSSAMVAGVLDYLTNADATVTTDTSIGVGGPSEGKYRPIAAGLLKDHAPLRHCDCANSITWFYVMLEAVGTVVAGNVSVRLAIRRVLKKYDLNYIVLPKNDKNLEGFVSSI